MKPSNKITKEVREEIAFNNTQAAGEVRAMHRDNYTHHHYADLQREADYYAQEEAAQQAKDRAAAWKKTGLADDFYSEWLQSRSC